MRATARMRGIRTASAQDYDVVIADGRVVDLETSAINADAWHASKKDQWPVNYGTTVGQEGVRMLAHDPEAGIEGPQDATTILGSLQNVVAADGVASTVADTKNGKIYRNTIR